MKKVILVIALVMFSISSMGQKKLVGIGIEAGMNFNKMSFDNEMFESENRLGFFVGPKVKFNLPLLGFGCDAALLYSMSSAQVNFRYHDINNSAQAFPVTKPKNLSYIEIPMNLRYTFDIQAVAIYLATGPQYNYCISFDETVKDMFYDRVPYDYSRSTWGWSFGGGIEILNHLQIGITYTIPLSNNGYLSGDDFENLFSESHYDHSTIKARLAYYF
jgi:hypothetical protein